jgi:hypothetical protein
MTDGKLLIVASTLEIVTGFSLLAAPSYVVKLLINTGVIGAGLLVGRLCGFGLLSWKVARCLCE